MLMGEMFGSVSVLQLNLEGRECLSFNFVDMDFTLIAAKLMSLSHNMATEAFVESLLLFSHLLLSHCCNLIIYHVLAVSRHCITSS